MSQFEHHIFGIIIGMVLKKFLVLCREFVVSCRLVIDFQDKHMNKWIDGCPGKSDEHVDTSRGTNVNE